MKLNPHVTFNRVSKFNYMGFAMYEVLINGIPTGTKLHASNLDHAYEMYHQHQQTVGHADWNYHKYFSGM